MKKVLVFMLAFSFVFLHISSLAYAVNTPSNATTKYEIASPSDAEIYMDPINLMDYLGSDDGIMLFSDGVEQFSSQAAPIAIPASYVPYADVFDASGKWIVAKSAEYISSQSTDEYLYFRFPSLPDGQYYGNFYFSYGKTQLPAPGTYGVTATVWNGHISAGYSSCYFRTAARADNVGYSYNNANASLSVLSRAVATGNVTIGYKTSSVWAVFALSEKMRDLDVCTLSSGALKFSFQQQTGGTAVSPDVAAGGSAQDYIADASQQIQQNTASMADTLKEIVQTISNQLAALWDQMFNLMHVPQLANDDKNTQRIIDKLGDDLNVEIQNDNDNTETIINGYDNSGMESSNETLDQGMQEYDAAESAIVDQVSGYIEDFEFPSYTELPVSVVTGCLFFGNYLQDLFESMGAFNFPITLSLTMIFVLILIGYHRVRSNG